MKTPEELIALKNEVETMNEKLAELTDDELGQVAGGYESKKRVFVQYCKRCGFLYNRWVIKGSEELNFDNQNCSNCNAMLSVVVDTEAYYISQFGE